MNLTEAVRGELFCVAVVSFVPEIFSFWKPVYKFAHIFFCDTIAVNVC